MRLGYFTMPVHPMHKDWSQSLREDREAIILAEKLGFYDVIVGVSPGALASDAEALGILEQDRNKMFAESIDVILAIWEREPPYDIDFPDNRYKVSTSRTQA